MGSPSGLLGRGARGLWEGVCANEREADAGTWVGRGRECARCCVHPSGRQRLLGRGRFRQDAERRTVGASACVMTLGRLCDCDTLSEYGVRVRVG